MTVLYWQTPKRRTPVADWKKDNVFDGGPPGGYLPNMSDEDMLKWKAKLVGVSTSTPAVEIRKTAGSEIKLVVREHDHDMSMNGKAKLTAADFHNMFEAVKEARAVLADLKNQKGA